MVVIFHRGGRVSRRHLFLTLGDWTAIVASQVGAVFIRLGADEGWAYLLRHWPTFLSAICIYVLVFYAGGMYEPPTRTRRIDFDFLPMVVTSIAAALTGLVLYTRPQMTLGRGIWGLSSVMILVLAYLLRHVFINMIGRGFFLRRAFVLCDHPHRAADLLRLLKENSMSPYHVLGMVLCGSLPARDYPADPPVRGEAKDLEALIAANDVSALLLSVSPVRSHELLPRLRPLRYVGVEIMDYVSLSEELAQEIPLAHINDEWLMTSALNSSILQVRKVKRVVDIAVSLLGLVPGIPLMALAALLIRATSPGPAIFRQKRVGLGGQVYTLYKLRTMRADAESAGAVWSGERDPRVTGVGYFLRKWRIDELPQLFNILKGEMSLVGPRPERPEFTEKLASLIPFYNERLLVQPGLTGWAQIKFPYAASFESAARKLQYDLFYVKNMGFLMDAAILLKTFKTILMGLRHGEEFLTTDDGHVSPLVGQMQTMEPSPPKGDAR
jgi:exopolysaccharide biosynthesis polyprenyl glycosylphosphotransferase